MPLEYVVHMCWLKCDANMRAFLERFANTDPSATEAEFAMSGYSFAVAGVETIGRDGRFDNDEQMQHMVHLLLDPMRARRLLDEADALEAQRFAHGVEGPAPPAAVGADGEEDQEEEEEEEEGDMELLDEEEGWPGGGGISGEEEEEEEEEGDMESQVATMGDDEGEEAGVVQKALQFNDGEPDAEPAPKRAKTEELHHTYTYIYIYIYAYI